MQAYIFTVYRPYDLKLANLVVFHVPCSLHGNVAFRLHNLTVVVNSSLPQIFEPTTLLVRG